MLLLHAQLLLLLLQSIEVRPILLPCSLLLARMCFFLCLQELGGHHMVIVLGFLLLLVTQER